MHVRKWVDHDKVAPEEKLMPETQNPIVFQVALLGNYPPRQCGIATFTTDLRHALTAHRPEVVVDVIAMSDRSDYNYPAEVRYKITERDLSAYISAADLINQVGYDVLSVQHEYGIFGGESGSYLMSLVRQAKMPIVTTLHTVLQAPSPSEREVLDELLQLSQRVVVMSKKAVSFLMEVHNVSRDKIDLIPHGIPDISESAGKKFRLGLNISGPMIFTFGLLSPDKGIQYVIEAMPQIARQYPGATYVVVGATHPAIRSHSGETYRESLVKLADELGVAENVRFVDRFVEPEELVLYLGAMDIYVTPYLNPKQITSGTLAYAIGAGKAVISTPYWYARELLDEGRGVLVPFRDAGAISEAVRGILEDAESRQEMGRRSALFGKQMLWPEVGKSYLASFVRAKQESSESLRMLMGKPLLPSRHRETLPSMHLGHLKNLSDDTGILQHARFSVPNRAEGYCVDDNARALLFTAYLASEGSLSEEESLLQGRYLSFVLDAYNPENGRFRNFMNFSRGWLEESGSEDSHGRALWSLGAIVGRCEDRGRRGLARELFETSAPALLATTSPRTWAYGILAAEEYLSAFPQQRSVQDLMHTLGRQLLTQYQLARNDAWPWFEQSLSYANARLSQALIVAGKVGSHNDMFEAGLDSLAWLMDIQSGAGGVFVPIGTHGFSPHGGERILFDQQPIEASSSVSACLTAGRVTGNKIWFGHARRSFNWFLGHNMLGQPLYDLLTGGCYDGLHADRVNQNQGAESTLSFLCALSEMRGTNMPSATAAKAELL